MLSAAGSFHAPMGADDVPMSKLSLRHRIRSHWHGEQDLVQAFGYCLSLVVMPIGLSGIAAWLLQTAFPYSSRGTALFISNVGGLLTVLADFWWCAGVHAMSMRRLERNGMVRALLLFLVAGQGFWWVAGSWVPTLMESAREDWINVWHPLASESRSWSRKPLQVPPLPELHRFSVTGSVGWGSAKAVEAAITANPEIRLIEIESTGGYVREADLIVDMVRKYGLDTLVRGKCYSACTEIYLAGQRRYVGPQARFGFHQSGYEGRGHDTHWSITEHESSIFYRSKGVAQQFMEQALNTSYYDLWRPDVYDVKVSGFATNWFSDRPGGH